MRNSILIVSCLFSFNFLISQVTMKATMPPSLDAGRPGDVEVTINKGGIQNFTKYQMDVPAGIIITEVDSKGGNFTFENNRAKIVWVSAPSEPEFKIKFKIAAGAGAPSQANIDQKFYYLENGTKKEVSADMVMLSINANNAIAQTETPATSSQPVNTSNTSTQNTSNTTSQPVTETKKTEPVSSSNNTSGVAKTEPVKSEPVKTEPAKTEAKTMASAPPPNLSGDGFVYRVQLAAAVLDAGKSKYASLGANNIVISKEDGLYKVLYGTYNSKEDALKAREEAAAKGFNGFVVKYKDGVRVK